MVHDQSLKHVLRQFGLRLGAVGVVLGIFFGLGYINRTDFLGLASLLDSQFAFFIIAFGLVGVASLIWIGFQQYRQ